MLNMENIVYFFLSELDISNEEEHQVGGAGGNFTISVLFEEEVPTLNTIGRFFSPFFLLEIDIFFTGRAFKITFHDLENAGNIHALFYDCLQQMVERAFAEATDHDLVGAEIRHPGSYSV
jgi:hypothetical protein